MNTDLSLTLAEEILKEKLKDIHFIRSDETYVRVLEAMEAYALERTQKWISIKERLPKDYERVLFFDMLLKAWQTGYFVPSQSEVPEYVTHWMPLPEPPKI